MKYSIFLFLLMFLMVNSIKAQQNEVKITNAGYNGNNTADLLARLDKDVFSKEPDLVVMMIGTNDMLNVRNILKLAEFEANYEELIKKIMANAKLILMTIPPIENVSLTKRIGGDLYGLEPKARIDAANEIINRLAKKSKCKLVNLNQILTACGGSTNDKTSIFQNIANSNSDDGVHPTKEGYLIIGTAVYQAVISSFPNVKRIVCFGDSITFGYKMQGEGKINGDSYPAVLNRMMNNTK